VFPVHPFPKHRALVLVQRVNESVYPRISTKTLP
jgi:hypothetical protein